MHKSMVVGLVALVGVMGMASSAKAEDLTVSLGGGASEVLDTYNADAWLTHNKFQLGENGVAKAMFKVVGPLAIGVQANGSYFEQAQPNNSTGVMWTFAPTVNLQTSHDAGAYAYIDGAFGPSVQDHIWNAGVLASAGVDFSIEPTRTYWVGPFVSYTHVFDLASSQSSLVSSHHDMNTAVVGLELAFDFPVKQKKVEHIVVVQTPAAPVATPVVCPPVAEAVAHAPAKNLFATLFFDKGSSTLSTASVSKLNALVGKMQSSPYYTVMVMGTASKDGPSSLNMKLSQSRSEVVVSFLANAGISPDRLHGTWRGAQGAPNDIANRNTIVIVLGQ